MVALAIMLLYQCSLTVRDGTLQMDFYPLKPCEHFIMHRSPVVTKENLIVLDYLVNYALKRANIFHSRILNETAVFYVHHALETSISLLESIVDIGIIPKNIFVLGKHYSNCEKNIKKAKLLGVTYIDNSPQEHLGQFSECFTADIKKAFALMSSRLDGSIRNIIIADHGGYALSNTPGKILAKYNVVGIEKTTAGIGKEAANQSSFPIVNVAECAAKKILESPLIANAVIKKISELYKKNILNEKKRCGVVGYGDIGKAITRKLQQEGCQVIVHDVKCSGKIEGMTKFTKCLNDLLLCSDVIFGCTGEDITQDIKIFCDKPGDTTYISCSSGDVEYLSLLKFIASVTEANEVSVLEDVIYKTDHGSTITILRGGFPINFDDSGESVPAKDIQLTRALVLSSILQALSMFGTSERRKQDQFIMLDPEFQRMVALRWMQEKGPPLFSKDILSGFGQLDWIRNKSKGLFLNKEVFV